MRDLFCMDCGVEYEYQCLCTNKKKPISFIQEFASSTCNKPKKAPTVKEISDAMKAAMEKLRKVPDFAQKEKELGAAAANLKFCEPEKFNNLSEEDKLVVQSAIDRAAYIIRQETFQRIFNPKIKL